MEPHHVASAAGSSSVGPDIGALYLEHRDVMYRVAYVLLRADRHYRAEDVISEVMVSILKNPPGDVRNWEAFFVRATRNKVLDFWKSGAHRHEQLALAEVSAVDDERLGGDDVEGDPAAGVLDLIGRQQSMQTVREAMAELAAWDGRAAHVLLQCTGLERPSGDVAAELGVSSSRVRQIAAQATKKMRSILEAKGVHL